jgi:vacuolar-type H+-ATPase subunit H
MDKMEENKRQYDRVAERSESKKPYEIIEIIDMMDEAFDKAFSIPFSGKVVIDKQIMADFLQGIRLAYPKEIQEARWVHKERERIINDAHEKADTILNETKEEIAKMVDEHSITQEAVEKAEKIINAAETRSLAITNECDTYVDALIGDAERRLEKLLKQAHDDRMAFKK